MYGIIARENGSTDIGGLLGSCVLLFGMACPGIGRYGGSDGLTQSTMRTCLVSPKLVFQNSVCLGIVLD